MRFAPLIEGPSIEEILREHVQGRARLLGRAEGYAGILGPERCVPGNVPGLVDTIVAQDVLPRDHRKALALVRDMVRQLVPGGTLILIEQSQPLSHGSRGVVRKGLELMGILHPPEEITAMFLRAGVLDVTQVWPQGVRALVVTMGRRAPFDSPVYE